MQKTFLLIFSIVIIYTSASAQLAGTPPQGPISAGLGGISSPLENSWSLFNNPAGLAAIEKANGVFGYQTIFNFAPFNTVAAAINFPTNIGTMSFGVYRFGDELFSSQMASLGFGRKIGIMSLGIKANLLQYTIDRFGKRSVFLAEMGGIAKLSPKAIFGIHIYNFTQSVVAAETQEKVPTIIRLSVNYQAADRLNFFVEGEKDVDLDPDLKLGLAYRVIEVLELRTGLSTINNRHSFGAGFKVRRFIIDYGLRSNLNVGTTHNFGLNFIISD